MEGIRLCYLSETKLDNFKDCNKTTFNVQYLQDYIMETRLRHKCITRQDYQRDRGFDNSETSDYIYS